MRRNSMFLLVPGLLLMIAAAGCVSHVAQAPPGDTQPPAPKELRITVNRTVGLTPLEVEIAGVLLDGARNEISLFENQSVHLEVATTHYRIVGGDRSNPFHTAGIDEIDAAGLENPMVRNIKIHRQGTYHFRLILEDDAGNRIRSNTVTVKAI